MCGLPVAGLPACLEGKGACRLTPWTRSQHADAGVTVRRPRVESTASAVPTTKPGHAPRVHKDGGPAADTQEERARARGHERHAETRRKTTRREAVLDALEVAVLRSGRL